MTITLPLATQNALLYCASILSSTTSRVLVVTSNLHLAEILLEYLQLSPGIHSSLIRTGEDTPQAAWEAAYSLAWIQPLQEDQNCISTFLRDRQLRQVVVLQAGWLGRRMLSEWKSFPGRNLQTNFQIRRVFSSNPGWSYREVCVGNLGSLFWGFMSGRWQALGRPDLAARCSARMRRQLLPATGRPALNYLSIGCAFRGNPAQVQIGSSLDGRQEAG